MFVYASMLCVVMIVYICKSCVHIQKLCTYTKDVYACMFIVFTFFGIHSVEFVNKISILKKKGKNEELDKGPGQTMTSLLSFTFMCKLG